MELVFGGGLDYIGGASYRCPFCLLKTEPGGLTRRTTCSKRKTSQESKWSIPSWPGYLVPLKSAKVLAFGADEIARRCSFWCLKCEKMPEDATKRPQNGYITATKRLNPENFKIAPTSRSIKLCLELPHTRQPTVKRSVGQSFSGTPNLPLVSGFCP